MRVHDKEFRVMIEEREVAEAIARLAERLNADYAPGVRADGARPPLFVAVLNGAFMFAAELLKRIDFPCEVSFVKLASYEGTGTTGTVRELIGLEQSVEGRDVIVLEDTVDTGTSIAHLLKILAAQRPVSVAVAAMLFKPGAFRGGYEVRYRAMEIGNEFVVGYGLDYDGLGRNLKDIWVVED